MRDFRKYRVWVNKSFLEIAQDSDFELEAPLIIAF